MMTGGRDESIGSAVTLTLRYGSGPRPIPAWGQPRRSGCLTIRRSASAVRRLTIHVCPRGYWYGSCGIWTRADVARNPALPVAPIHQMIDGAEILG